MSDKKIQVNNNGEVGYYTADVRSASDYYPGGMVMPGRSSNSQDYRFGFQNQEIDKELWGGAAAFTYRVEDPRLVRFFSVDPLTGDYPHNSPYAFAENRLIDGVELEGLEWEPSKDKKGYNWVGYNADGSAVKGSVPSAVLNTGDAVNIYSSDAKSRSGRLDVINFNKPDRPDRASEVHDATKEYNYSISFNHVSYGKSGDGYNVTAQLSGNLGSYPSATIDAIKGGGYSDRDAIRTAAKAFGVGPQPTHIETDGLGPVDYLLGIGEFKLSKAGAKIIGSAQTTGTLGHAFTSRLIAWRYALDPRVERVTLDLGYKRLLGGGAFKWGPRPDVGVLFRSGRVKVFEVMSKTDIELKLFRKNQLFMNRNSILGSIQVVKPFSLKSLYK